MGPPRDRYIHKRKKTTEIELTSTKCIRRDNLPFLKSLKTIPTQCGNTVNVLETISTDTDEDQLSYL